MQVCYLGLRNVLSKIKKQMEPLFLLQFACFVFMLLNAFIVAAFRLHAKWESKRYERSRWMIVAAMLGLAIQYGMQMFYGFRAADDGLGAVVNILIYTPCFSLLSLSIYNIEAPRASCRKMNLVCGGIYAVILLVFCVSGYLGTRLYIREGLYLMLALFAGSVSYCISMIVRAMVRRKNMLERMAATDILPYVRFSRASVFILLLAFLMMPIAILSTPLLFIVGPVALFAILFFNLTFVALGSNYTPTDELLEKEEENGGVMKMEKLEYKSAEECRSLIQNRLDDWCAHLGYKDRNVNMLSLSYTLGISKDDLSFYFDQCLNSTFRIWLSDIRFDAAKKMMLEYPDYSNDIISMECGFSSRTYLYRIFKAKEGCTPTEWRVEQAEKCK